MNNGKINWDSIEKEQNQFAPMAEVGKHTVKVSSIDLRETKNAQGNTTYWLDFLIEEDDFKYPKISHPISFKNAGWRQFHFMSILKELGIAEEKAKKAIEMAEDKKGEENIVASYHSTFDRATQKHPEITIDVYESDNLNPNTGRPYMRADFANSKIGFGRPAKKTAPAGGSILEGAEEVSSEELLPF